MTKVFFLPFALYSPYFYLVLVLFISFLLFCYSSGFFVVVFSLFRFKSTWSTFYLHFSFCSFEKYEFVILSLSLSLFSLVILFIFLIYALNFFFFFSLSLLHLVISSILLYVRAYTHALRHARTHERIYSVTYIP